MSEFKRLDDIERREHRDMKTQWFVGMTFGVLMLAVVLAMFLGP